MNQEEQFLALQEELQPYVNLLSEATDRVLDQEVTKYPIFIAHKTELAIGLPLVDRDDIEGGIWSINVSSLEEFNTKQVIPNNKVEDFKEVYKDPEDWICIFYIGEMGQNFLFLPRNY
jgi:hypothetical protein